MSMNARLEQSSQLHAARMDRMYRMQRHFYDATRVNYLLGRDQLIDGLAASNGTRILEVGCGTGRNLVKAVKRYPQAAFFGLDISSEMLLSAKTSLQKIGAAGRVRLALGDAVDFNCLQVFGQPSFERIFFSYTLSMVPGWEEALANAYDQLSSGGSLHIADFGDCNGLPQWFHYGLQRWLSLFHVTPRYTIDGALLRLAERSGGCLCIARPLRGYVVLATLTKPAAASASGKPTLTGDIPS